MKGFGGLDRALASTVHFITRNEYSEELPEFLTHIRTLGIEIVYVDFACTPTLFHLVTKIAQDLSLRHTLYNEKFCLLQLLDDLMGLATSADGVVIMIDHAGTWEKSQRREFYDFIETFLTQTDDWLSKKKPCYLLLQMEHDPRVSKAFCERAK